MQITITINTDNAAFERWPEGEVARILTDYARKLADHEICFDGDTVKMRDINGNTVGAVEITEAN